MNIYSSVIGILCLLLLLRELAAILQFVGIVLLSRSTGYYMPWSLRAAHIFDIQLDCTRITSLMQHMASNR